MKQGIKVHRIAFERIGAGGQGRRAVMAATPLAAIACITHASFNKLPLIQAWVSHKSFVRKDGADDEPPQDGRRTGKACGTQ